MIQIFQQFHLSCSPKIDQTRVNAWISTVVKRNVRDITISDHFYRNLRFPRNLFNCKTLESLKLDWSLRFKFPSSVYLPCLKVLHLALRSPSNDLTEKFFCSSPVLEHLKLYVEDDSGRSKYNISSPALKKLSMYVSTDQLKEYNSVVTVDAPVLEVLNVSGYCCMYYNFKSISSSCKAYLDVDAISHSRGDLRQANELFELLIAISDVKNLVLGPLTLASISYAVEKKGPILPNITGLVLKTPEFMKNNDFSRWPTFPNVTRLQMNVEDFGSNNMSNFLALVPNLSYLVFKRVPILQSLDEYDFSEEQKVPTCLVSCLKKIIIRGIEGLQSELKLVKYLLESAQVLEELTIENCEFREIPEEKFKAEISGMHRGSKNSQVCLGRLSPKSAF